MLVLAIDTANELGSLALARGEELLECVELHAGQAHGAVVFEKIRALLQRHQVALKDIELYGAAAGPGSFTGVRVALAAAKAFAVAHGKPVVAVSNLAAIAAFAPAEARHSVAVVDARRGEFYAGVFERDGDGWRAAAAEFVAPAASIQERLAAMDLPHALTVVCSPDVAKLDAVGFPKVATPPWLAPAVAKLALADWRAGRASPPAAIDANYVRRPV